MNSRKPTKTAKRVAACCAVGGLALIGGGVLFDQRWITFAGLVTTALGVRYAGTTPARHLAWLLLFIAVLTSVVLLAKASPANSISFGMVPLMLSYVFDYVDERIRERREKRCQGHPAAPPDANN